MDISKQPAVVVVGAGYWGKNLVRSFHSLHALGRVCDSDPERLQSFRSDYADVTTETRKRGNLVLYNPSSSWDRWL